MKAQDMKGTLDELDAMLGLGPGAGAGAEEGAAGEGAEGEMMGEAPDMAPLAAALRISPEAAEDLYDAAQAHEDLAGLSPEDLGKALAKDPMRVQQLQQAVASQIDADAESGAYDEEGM